MPPPPQAWKVWRQEEPGIILTGLTETSGLFAPPEGQVGEDPSPESDGSKWGETMLANSCLILPGKGLAELWEMVSS